MSLVVWRQHQICGSSTRLLKIRERLFHFSVCVFGVYREYQKRSLGGDIGVRLRDFWLSEV